jgi:hypothetical protein
MYTDYLYNLQQHAKNVTNWNLKIGPAFSSGNTNSNGTIQKENTPQLAQCTRENPKRLGGISSMLQAHALPSVQDFQKTQYEVHTPHHRY